MESTKSENISSVITFYGEHGSSIRDEDNVSQKVVKIRNGPECRRTTSARERGYSCPGGDRQSTRQNRTTVNGSSLQSSYFLMMAGPGRRT